MNEKPDLSFEFDDFRLDAKEMRLWRGDQILQVSPKALKVLLLLLESRGQIVTRNEIMDKIWGDAFVEEGNLNVHISNLRKVLSENSSKTKDFIRTLPKHGYCFLVDITKIPENVSEKATEPQEPTVEQSSTLPPPIRRIRWHFVAIVILGMLFVSSFALWLRFGDNSALSSVPLNKRNMRSLAILPMKNLDGKEQNQILSLGLTDSLISRLGRLNHFAVRPLSAVSEFPKSGKDAIAFGKELKVDAALTGTIRESGDRLRVNVRLIDVRDGAIIWTGSFDEIRTDILKLEDSLSIRVANGILSEVSQGDKQLLTQKTTDDPEAHRMFLRGKFYQNKRTNEGLLESIDYFDKAIKIDPKLAEAYVGIADAKWLLKEGKRGYASPDEVIQTVRKNISRAIELDPNLPGAYTTLADVQMYQDWNQKSAELNFKKAIRINPNLDKAHHWYAWLLIADERFDEARAELELAHNLNPTSLIISTEKGYPDYAAGEYDEAIKQFKAALKMDPTFLDAHIGLLRAYRATGNTKELAAELDEIKKLTSEAAAIYQYFSGVKLAAEGSNKEAKDILTSLVLRREKGEYISPVYLAILSLETGNKDQVYKWLDEGFKERNDYMPFLKVGPEFTSIRDEPRFKAIYDRMNLAK